MLNDRYCNVYLFTTPYAKKSHLFVYLSTNGLDLTESIADRLVALGIGSVNISIDGDNAITHDAFRGRSGAYGRAIESIKLLRDRGIPCGSQTTIFRGNFGQSEHIYDAMQAFGVKSCSFVRMSPQGRGKRNADLIPTLDEYRLEREKDYRNRRLKYGLELYSEHGNQARGGKRCSAGVSQMYIRADGHCFPCPSLEIPEFEMGDFSTGS